MLDWAVSLSLKAQLAFVLVFNAVIALLVSVLLKGNYIDSYILSNAIGLTAFGSHVLITRRFGFRSYYLMIPILAGSTLGSLLGYLFTVFYRGIDTQYAWRSITGNYMDVLSNILIGLFFGLVILYFLVVQSRVKDTHAALQQEKIKNLEKEKAVAESRLKLLQAQIEPHFLFNTLAAVVGLIDNKPGLAKDLLGEFTQYLRSTLKYSRTANASLAQELDLIRHYLEIGKVRMGKRLEYAIQGIEGDGNILFPPMLLQPLVENAVIHGIEPAEAGGRVQVDAEVDDSLLRVTVSDTGAGLKESTGNGFGLTYIRDRLASLYGKEASFRIIGNHPTGVQAIIEVPLETC